MSEISSFNIKTFKYFSIAILVVCCFVYLVASWAWPFVNDAVLIRYATFLLDRGFAPYRQIYDLNLPGSYLVDWTIKHLLGESALAWRVFDSGLLAMICWAMFALARPLSRFAGIYAGLFFTLFHARNGIAQLGQRDLVVAVLLMGGSALVFANKWPRNYLRYICFGAMVGLASIIKPQSILFLPAAVVPYANFQRSQALITADISKKATRDFSLAALSAFIPIMGAFLWLIGKHSLPEFWRIATTFIPLHARLGEHGFFYLFGRCLTASHLTILALAIVLALTSRRGPALSPHHRRIRMLAIYGMGFGFLSYMTQLKAYPYHRYPFVAFLSLFAAVEFAYALSSSRPRRLVAVGGISFGLVLSVLYANHALHDKWQLAQVDSLTADLDSLGGTRLDGNIQCVDTIDGCLAALYRLHLTQSTGALYDEFLFLPPDVATQSENRTVSDVKNDVLGHMLKAPPYLIVVTPWLFPDGPGDYEKLRLWPAFHSFLIRCYEMRIERHIVGGQSDHPGYRIYVHKPVCE